MFLTKKKIFIFLPAVIIAATLGYLYFYRPTPVNIKNQNAAKDDSNKPKVVCDYSATGKVAMNSAQDNQGCLYLGCGAFF